MPVPQWGKPLGHRRLETGPEGRSVLGRLWGERKLGPPAFRLGQHPKAVQLLCVSCTKPRHKHVEHKQRPGSTHVNAFHCSQCFQDIQLNMSNGSPAAPILATFNDKCQTQKQEYCLGIFPLWCVLNENAPRWRLLPARLQLGETVLSWGLLTSKHSP